jgi:hypothetical protein
MNVALPKPVLPPSIQTQLGLRDPRVRSISDVKAVLRDLGEFEIGAEQIRDLVEQRVLIGFDIGVQRHAGGRCELRILTKSIEFFRTTNGRKYHELEWQKIFRLICPHNKPLVRGTEIARTLICDGQHVLNLLDARLFSLVPGSRFSRGPGGSPCITRESYEQFLKGRLL